MIARRIRNKEKKVPNRQRAPATGKYAVIVNGKREFRFYYSGQPIEGRIGC
jgi:hypothetical protein